jgi:transcriptional regulator with XRE-family HTH domain
VTAATLAAIRARLGWTQLQLAEALGIDHNTVSRYELGRLRIPEPVARLVERIERERSTA